jgi:hypothetical protein
LPLTYNGIRGNTTTVTLRGAYERGLRLRNCRFGSFDKSGLSKRIIFSLLTLIKELRLLLGDRLPGVAEWSPTSHHAIVQALRALDPEAAAQTVLDRHDNLEGNLKKSVTLLVRALPPGPMVASGPPNLLTSDKPAQLALSFDHQTVSKNRSGADVRHD